ncbi:uncharacterized protein LOC106137701 [Amyelois transitella]|uniref:uncharacterized protein LOC106137701 n=1 Tax=Amyelois transitella TaxID=680683 RepID=UPI00067C9DE4|nr:uncharacterized protein LOC106137701 [Amyelois transitella]
MSQRLKYYAPLLAITMVFALYSLVFMGIILTKPAPCTSELPCADGKTCPAPWQCCDTGCCAPGSVPPRREPEHKEYPWYAQWPVLFLLGTLGGIVICCVYCLLCKRQTPNSVYMCSFACCVRRPNSNHDSAGSIYPPPRYSRCGSLHQAPPPYSEVTSKPDLYPLVLTCGEGDGKAGNYLMVQYFRNYLIRAPGSLSATSTAESLNSSFLCNAANEANTIIPPPYSCASNYEECRGGGCGRSLLRSLSSLTESRAPPPPRARTTPDVSPAPHHHRTREATAAFRENLITSPVQPLDPSFDIDLDLIDCELYCNGSCKPQLGTSPPSLSRRSPSNPDEDSSGGDFLPGYGHEAYGLRNLFSCPSPEGAGVESPPQPTSPTQTSRESTLRRLNDDRRHRRLDSAKKSSRTRKSSLYMPLSVAYPGRTSRKSPGTRTSSRSAPVTPCNPLVPNLLTFAPRVLASRHSSRSSRCEEESNPLLAEIEQIRLDHKF